MSPTFVPGDTVLVATFDSERDRLQRYDLVLVNPPHHAQFVFVRRVIGLPGESVSVTPEGLFLNDQLVSEASLPAPLRMGPWHIPRRPGATVHYELEDNEVFVLGDNLASASDSREYGPLPLDRVTGRVQGKCNPDLRTLIGRWLR